MIDYLNYRAVFLNEFILFNDIIQKALKLINTAVYNRKGYGNCYGFTVKV